MEGALGSTRMGSRSSTRHGPASVFQGRVRRWKKAWAPVAPITTPSAAAATPVLLFKWTPTTLPSTNANANAKDSTPEEPPPAKPLRFLPVSVVLQQKKEEAHKAAEEAEALRRLEKEAEATTNSAVEMDRAEAKDTLEDTKMGTTQPEETGVNVTESTDQRVEGDAQATRAQLSASLQDETPVPPQEPETASMDVDQSKL